MKIALIALIIIFTSCKDKPTKIIEYEEDLYQYIDTRPRNYSYNFISDNDTLKITILDSNAVNLINSPYEFVTIEGELNDSKGVERTWIFENITNDLLIEENPNKQSEIWIYGFQPNLDSNRRWIESRYSDYRIILEYSKLDPYFKDCVFLINVLSTKQ